MVQPRTFRFSADDAPYDPTKMYDKEGHPIESLYEGDPAYPRVWKLPDLVHRPQPDWLIEQVVEEKGLTIFFGPDKIGKSITLSSMLWAYAAGAKNWLHPNFKMHRPSDDREPVILYVLLEGQATFYSRFAAWREHQDYDVGDLNNFLVMDEGLSLFDQRMRWDDDSTWPDSAKKLWNVIEDQKPHILVIDTLSRATAGMDENSSDMAHLVGWLDHIRDHHDVATIIVHHTPLEKRDQDRPRGHGSLKGAASSYVSVRGEPSNESARIVSGPHRNAQALNPIERGEPGYWFVKQTYGNSFYVKRLTPQEARPEENKQFEAVLPSTWDELDDVTKLREVCRLNVSKMRKDHLNELIYDGDPDKDIDDIALNDPHINVGSNGIYFYRKRPK